MAARSETQFAMSLLKQPVRVSLMAAGLGLTIIALAAAINFRGSPMGTFLLWLLIVAIGVYLLISMLRPDKF